MRPSASLGGEVSGSIGAVKSCGRRESYHVGFEPIQGIVRRRVDDLIVDDLVILGSFTC